MFALRLAASLGVAISVLPLRHYRAGTPQAVTSRRNSLTRHVQVDAGSVFLDGKKVIDLTDLVEQVARRAPPGGA
jgi:hypothetical protein